MYVTGGIGLAYFQTRSSVSGSDGDLSDPAFGTTNYDDATFALSGAGGIEIRLTHGPHPFALDFAVRYHRNGEAEYLTEDDIVDNPDGSISIYPNRLD